MVSVSDETTAEIALVRRAAGLSFARLHVKARPFGIVRSLRLSVAGDQPPPIGLPFQVTRRLATAAYQLAVTPARNGDRWTPGREHADAPATCGRVHFPADRNTTLQKMTRDR